MAYSPADRLPRQFPFRTAHAYIALRECASSLRSGSRHQRHSTKFFGSLRPTYCVSDSGRSSLRASFYPALLSYNPVAISGWNALTVARRRTPASRDSFQGTDQFMPFALFTTLLETCSFESRQPLVGRYTNTIISTNNQQEIFGLHLLILGALNPVKLIWRSPCIHAKLKIMAWVL
jgi:hypothetical protein